MWIRGSRVGRWRFRLVLLGAVMAVLFASCDWNQYAFDSVNTGHDLTATAFTTSSVTGLHQAWSVAGPTSSPARLAVVGDTAYVAGSDTVTYSVLGCLPQCPPPPPFGPVSALRVADGAVRWVVAGPRLDGDCFTATESMGAPTVVAGKVLFLRSGQPQCVVGSSSYAKVSAKSIDAVTGAVGDPPSGYGPPDGDAVVTSDGGIYLSDDHLESFAAELYPTDATVVGPSGFAFTPDPSAAHQPGLGYRMGTPAVDAHHVYVVGVGGSLGTSPILFAIDRDDRHRVVAGRAASGRRRLFAFGPVGRQRPRHRFGRHQGACFRRQRRRLVHHVGRDNHMQPTVVSVDSRRRDRAGARHQPSPRVRPLRHDSRGVSHRRWQAPLDRSARRRIGHHDRARSAIRGCGRRVRRHSGRTAAGIRRHGSHRLLGNDHGVLAALVRHPVGDDGTIATSHHRQRRLHQFIERVRE